MRRIVLAVAAVVVALIVQLSVLNGLHLPGGAVPDLVLVLVAAIAIISGPVPGMVTGFAAGLALDVAPPGSAVFGEYALVFCLVGWAAGKCNRLLGKSALLSVVLLGVIVAAGEVFAAGLGRALDPAQVDIDQIQHVLPYSVAYDLAITPFVLILAFAGAALAAHERHDALEEAGAHSARSAVATTRPHRRPRPHELHLAPGSTRPHDGWVGSRPPGLTGRPVPQRRPAMPHGLRPADGVAGSAAARPARHNGLIARPVNLNLAGKRRGDGMVGSPVGSALGRHPGLHPARPGAASSSFRPHSGMHGGSAAGQYAAMAPAGWRRPVSLRFGSRRRDGTVGRLLGTPPAANGSVRTTGLSGRALGIHFHATASPSYRPGPLVTPRSRRKAEPKFRQTPQAAPRSRRKAAPRFHQSPPATARYRRKAEPRFKRVAPVAYRSLTTGLQAGGALDQATVMSARRRYLGTPRLRLGTGRRGDGTVGSVLTSGRGLHGSVRPATPRFKAQGRPLPGRHTPSGGKQPHFGYGRHSVLSFLAGRRIGGKWLATTRVGSRSGVWVLGKRTGGAR